MGGKAAILLVLGFSMIFLVFGYNFANLTTRAVDNLSEYYTETVAYNIASAGANMAANKIFIDPTWDDGYSDIDFSGGKITIEVTLLDAQKNIIQVTSTGFYENRTKSIQVILQPTRFSQFAYFCQIEGNIWWTANDTVWGPFHTQDWMRVQGHPYFYGKATTKKGMRFYSSETADKPVFAGGYEDGVNLDLPDDKVKDFKDIAEANGALFLGNRHNDNFYLTFKEDSLSYKTSLGGVETTVYLPDFAPNGNIHVHEGNFHIKGVVKGEYTVSAWGPNSGLGRIYLEDDIVYSEHPYSDDPHDPNDLPLPNPDCNDLLGIVARNHVLITDNADNNNDINIHASIFSEKEGFGAENYSSRGFDGNINLIGGLIQKKRQPVGTFRTDRWGNITGQTGFNKRYKYDSRMMFVSPPSFPATDSYQIVSWYE